MSPTCRGLKSDLETTPFLSWRRQIRLAAGTNIYILQHLAGEDLSNRQRFKDFSCGSQGQIPALTVFHVPYKTVLYVQYKTVDCLTYAIEYFCLSHFQTNVLNLFKLFFSRSEVDLGTRVGELLSQLRSLVEDEPDFENRV